MSTGITHVKCRHCGEVEEVCPPMRGLWSEGGLLVSYGANNNPLELCRITEIKETCALVDRMPKCLKCGEPLDIRCGIFPAQAPQKSVEDLERRLKMVEDVIGYDPAVPFDVENVHILNRLAAAERKLVDGTVSTLNRLKEIEEDLGYQTAMPTVPTVHVRLSKLEQAGKRLTPYCYSQGDLDAAVAKEREYSAGRIVSAFHRGDSLYTQADLDAAVEKALREEREGNVMWIYARPDTHEGNMQIIGREDTIKELKEKLVKAAVDEALKKDRERCAATLDHFLQLRKNKPNQFHESMWESAKFHMRAGDAVPMEPGQVVPVDGDPRQTTGGKDAPAT